MAAFFIETIYSWLGMAASFSTPFCARLPHDHGVMLVVAIVVLIANLLTDLTYGAVDPRIRLQGQAREPETMTTADLTQDQTLLAGQGAQIRPRPPAVFIQRFRRYRLPCWRWSSSASSVSAIFAPLIERARPTPSACATVPAAQRRALAGTDRPGCDVEPHRQRRARQAFWSVPWSSSHLDRHALRRNFRLLRRLVRHGCQRATDVFHLSRPSSRQAGYRRARRLGASST